MAGERRHPSHGCVDGRSPGLARHRASNKVEHCLRMLQLRVDRVPCAAALGLAQHGALDSGPSTDRSTTDEPWAARRRCRRAMDSVHVPQPCLRSHAAYGELTRRCDFRFFSMTQSLRSSLLRVQPGSSKSSAPGIHQLGIAGALPPSSTPPVARCRPRPLGLHDVPYQCAAEARAGNCSRLQL